MTKMKGTPMKSEVAVVTGAASGIGRATAERLMADGLRVVAVDQADPPVGDVRLSGDVTDEKVNQQVAEAAVAEFGGLDAVILNAGVLDRGKVDTIDMEVLDRVLAVNLRAVAIGIQETTPALRSRGGGAIVVTASIAGFGGGHHVFPYGVSKAAVLSLVRHAALDLAEYGIRVNAVCPGVIATAMTQYLKERPADYERLRSNVPLGRWAGPEEVAAVIPSSPHQPPRT